jgi:hypothetical protein
MLRLVIVTTIFPFALVNTITVSIQSTDTCKGTFLISRQGLTSCQIYPEVADASLTSTMPVPRVAPRAKVRIQLASRSTVPQSQILRVPVRPSPEPTVIEKLAEKLEAPLETLPSFTRIKSNLPSYKARLDLLRKRQARPSAEVEVTVSERGVVGGKPGAPLNLRLSGLEPRDRALWRDVVDRRVRLGLIQRLKEA